MLKVMFVIDSLEPGGTEVSTARLAPRLGALGIEFSIVTLRRSPLDLVDEVRREGGQVTTLTATSRLARVRELRRLVRQSGPAVVHSALYEADQVARLATIGLGVSVVSSFVSVPARTDPDQQSRLLRAKIRISQLIDIVGAHVLVDHFHAVSPGVKAEHERVFRLSADRVTVVNRGRDADVLGTRTAGRRSDVRRSLAIADSTPVVLNIGRHDPAKGQTDLIRASDLLQQRQRHLMLIAGKAGAATAQLEALAAVSPQVRLLGHRDDIGDLLCAADVLVMSSHYEGAAGAALEAMALSTPIVSTDLVGISGILEHERNALLVPLRDPTAIASAVERLLLDPQFGREIAARAASDFTAAFTLEQSTNSLAALYRSVVG